jgi:Flp pilus assembly protein TadD
MGANMNIRITRLDGNGYQAGGRRHMRPWPIMGLFAALFAVTGCAASAPQVNEDALRATAQSQETILSAAEADIAARRFQLASQRLARLDAAMGETPRVQYAMAEVLLGLDRPNEALARYQAVETDPAHQGLAWQGMGLALLAIGDVPQATAQLERAVAADPKLWRAWAGLGRAHDEQKRWADAAAAYDGALAANPGAAVILNNMGMSLLLQHRYAEAAAAFESAIAKDPAMETARSNLRIALAWQDRYDEALAGLQAAERADALNNIGYVAMLRSQYPQAQRFFTQAMEASPTYHHGAAKNLEALKLLAKSKDAAALPQTADTPTP